jgi:hypothetical protein
MFLAVPIVAVASVAFKYWLEWLGTDAVTEATSGEAVPVPRVFSNAQTPATERAIL